MLTARQFEIALLLVDGWNIKQIARKLNLSVKAVESHRRNLYRHLKIKTPVKLVGLIHWAIREGWIVP